MQYYEQNLEPEIETELVLRLDFINIRNKIQN